MLAAGELMKDGRVHRQFVRAPWTALAVVAVLEIGCSSGGGSTPDAGVGVGGASAGAGGAAGGGAGSAGTGGAGGGGTGGAAGAGTVLVQGEDSPTTIAVDDTYLYWTTTSAIRRAPKAGGTATTLFPGLTSPDDLRADATALYWTSTLSGQGIMSGLKTGGQPSTVVPGTIGHLAVDTDSVYGVDNTMSPNVLLRAPKAGGAAPVTITTQRTFGEMDLDDQFLYWTEGFKGRVQRVAKAGGTIMDLRPADPGTVILAKVDATDVYFATVGAVAQSSTLNRVSKTGGATTTLATGLDIPTSLAVTADAVYWAAHGDVGSNGDLLKLSKTDSSVVARVPSQSAYGIAIDAQYVYWTELGVTGSRNGRILRMAR
jgi:hypothetical protein